MRNQLPRTRLAALVCSLCAMAAVLGAEGPPALRAFSASEDLTVIDEIYRLNLEAIETWAEGRLSSITPFLDDYRQVCSFANLPQCIEIRRIEDAKQLLIENQETLYKRARKDAEERLGLEAKQLQTQRKREQDQEDLDRQDRIRRLATANRPHHEQLDDLALPNAQIGARPLPDVSYRFRPQRRPMRIHSTRRPATATPQRTSASSVSEIVSRLIPSSLASDRHSVSGEFRALRSRCTLLLGARPEDEELRRLLDYLDLAIPGSAPRRSATSTSRVDQGQLQSD